jgi:arabinosaccharide transport system substrate-binding protein
MSNKKIVVAILALTLVVGLLSTVGLSAPRTVNMWLYAENNKAEWDGRKAEIEKAMDIKLNITLVAQNAFIQKLQAAMMDGKDFPDIIEWMIENNRILYADPKVSFVYPLEKWTSKSTEFKNVPAGRVAFVTYGKHVYGLPHDIHPCILIYNDALWKSVGVDMATIETWDEYFAAAEKLAAEKKDGKPAHYAIPQNDGLNGTMYMMLQQSGAQILDKNGKPAFTSPEFKAFMNKWLGYLKTGTMCSWDWGNFSALLQNGGMASYASPDWYTEKVNDGAKAGVQFKARPLPVFKKGGPRTASWGGTFLAICKLAKNPDQLYKVIEYMQYSNAIKYRYRDTGMLPPNMALLDDPSFKVPDPRFGGQKLGELQVQMAREMPGLNTGDVFWDAINDFNEEYTEIVSGKKSVDDGLKAAQAKTMARLKKK